MAKVKLPPNYNQTNFKKSSDAVLYDNSALTLKLNNLSRLQVSEIGRTILQSENLENFRRNLKVGLGEDFFDETENIHWEKVGSPSVSNGVLYTSSGNYIQSKEQITFGGADFTISFWATFSGGGTLFTTSDNLLQIVSGSSTFNFVYNGTTQNNVISGANSLSYVEINYSHSAGRIYLYKNGAYCIAPSVSLSRAARNVILGNMSATFKEFRILDGICAHTAAFTPPSEDYSLTDNTVSLLHFN